MKTLMSMEVLFAIIFLTLPLSMALAEKEDLTIQDNFMVMQNNTPMPNTMPISTPMNVPMNQIGLPNGAATNVTTNVIIQNVTFNLITLVNISNISLQGPHEYIEGPVQAPNSKGLSENQSDYTKGESHFEGA